MNNRTLAKFQDPGIKDQYLEKYGDPLDEVSPQDLMDLMENLWLSTRGSYAALRDSLTRKGMDPWTTRQELAQAYFKAMYLREHDLDEESDKSKVEDVTDFIRVRIMDSIREFQALEAEQDARTRDKFGIRMPRGY